MDFNLFGPVFLMLPLWYSCLAAQHFSPSLISQETCGFLTIPPILCLRFLANNIQDICLALAPPSVMAAKLASLSDIFSKYHSGYLLWTICDGSLPVCLRFLAKSIQDICLAYGSTICDGNLPVCLHACCHCLQDEGMYFMGCSLDQLGGSGRLQKEICQATYAQSDITGWPHSTESPWIYNVNPALSNSGNVSHPGYPQLCVWRHHFWYRRSSIPCCQTVQQLLSICPPLPPPPPIQLSCCRDKIQICSSLYPL